MGYYTNFTQLKELLLQVKVILAVMKEIKQLQRKPRKMSESPTGFEPITMKSLKAKENGNYIVTPTG